MSTRAEYVPEALQRHSRSQATPGNACHLRSFSAPDRRIEAKPNLGHLAQAKNAPPPAEAFEAFRRFLQNGLFSALHDPS